MIREQLLPAFIASLVIEGVSAQQVELAVLRVLSLVPGRDLSGGDPLIRAFAFEQSKLLERTQ